MKGRTNILAVFGFLVIFMFTIIISLTLPLINSSFWGIDFTTMDSSVLDLWLWGLYGIALFCVVGMIKFGWGARW